MLSGCASKNLSVTYDSDIKGAALTCDGKNMGYTPVTLHYTLTKEQRENGYLYIIPCQARWISGAWTGNYRNTLINLKSNGYNQKITYTRPNDTGLETDMQFSMQLQQQKNLQNMQRQQAYNDAMNSLNQLGNTLNQSGSQILQQSNSFGPPTPQVYGIQNQNNRKIQNCYFVSNIKYCN